MTKARNEAGSKGKGEAGQAGQVQGALFSVFKKTNQSRLIFTYY